jgi:hypothetical protein
MPAPVKSIEVTGDTVTVTKTCPFCTKDAIITGIPRAGYELWGEGQGPFIQQSLPMLSDDDRGTLLSGSHGSCFDKAFPEE